MKNWGCYGLFVVFILFANNAFSQDKLPSERAILFYNTENLFDFTNDTITNDEDFTPEGMLHWNSYRYYRKINNISKVLYDANGWNTPFIIGLCEIENDKVLRDILYVGGLKNLHFKIVHYDSPDVRGIDVALLYNSNIFKILSSHPIKVTTEDGEFKTRDILYVKGIADGLDTLHLFVNHFPSRRGGQAQSEPKRILTATILHQKIDSVLAASPHAKVFAMGDFNDSPNDVAITDYLLKPFDNNAALISLAKPLADKGIGSHKFDGEWNMIDQMFISQSFLQEISVGDSTSTNGFNTVNLPYLTEDDEVNFGKKMVRTYLGPRYVGGYSDHLPIIFRYHKN